MGNVEVRETYKISKIGTIAGCFVTNGNIIRKNKIRLIRDGIVIFTGKIKQLKRFKEDANEVKSGYECGISIEDFNDIKVGDIIESFEIQEIKESFKFNIMAKVKTKYTAKELAEFEKLILEKKENAQKELDFIKESLLRSNLSGTDSTQGALKTLEDGADTMEKESLSQLAGRQQKFISNLENALIRIKNGTYGICKDSGKLIDKKRLRAVPHATQSIEAKLKRG